MRESIPEACCKLQSEERISSSRSKSEFLDKQRCLTDARNNVTSSEYVNVKGCSQALKEKLMEYATILLGLAIGVGLFQLIVVVMGIVFIMSLRK